ncbi:hypothetical protein [Frankia sp. R82]|uniref:hypothetical protein n=1 Tax=Frankia sp. R82 TaxID=2950553 RepID=UPI002043E18A|nr:hypothetical protein [Frankia sp. R82]
MGPPTTPPRSVPPRAAAGYSDAPRPVGVRDRRGDHPDHPPRPGRVEHADHDHGYQPSRRPAPGYPDPARAVPAPPAPQAGPPTGAWPADPRSATRWRADASGAAPAPEPGPADSGQFPIVDPLTSPLGEVRRLKEDR